MQVDLTALELAIVAAVPSLVAWLRPYLARLPVAVVPILAALLGIGIQALYAWAASPDVNLLAGALLGLAGVGLREVIDQSRKEAMRRMS